MNTRENRRARDLLTRLLLQHAGCSEEQQQDLWIFVRKSIRLHLERLVELIKHQLDVNTDAQQMMTNISHVDDFLTQSCRQRMNELCPSGDTNEDDVEFDNDIHVGVLKNNSDQLTRDLRIEGTTVLDILREREVLSSVGRQSIVKRKTPHDKNLAFLKVCNSLSYKTFQENVIPALENSNDEVNSKLANDIQNKIKLRLTKGKHSQPCIYHKIRSTVNHRRLADQLYQMDVISDQLREDLSSEHISTDTKWRKLLKMKRSKSLAVAIKKKYPDLYREMKLDAQIITTCTCTCTTETDTEDYTEHDDVSDIARMSDLSNFTALSPSQSS